MKAFRVTVNSKPVCTAGIGAVGVLHVIVSWLRRKGERLDGEFDFSVGGLDTASEEHVRWSVPQIGLGDEIMIRVVESDEIDTPSKRYSKSEAPGRGPPSNTTGGRTRRNGSARKPRKAKPTKAKVVRLKKNSRAEPGDTDGTAK
jgi:hypothetical protein